ncbi:MAG: orotidine-5'-phosphate decarboxylase [Chitinophagaceae bacterium]|nr:orotidine-5'-phosphate decarboxylase [Bacteroidota bacterium]MCC6258702.1 orotidine-5'-phosphate decarboxylase [Chitinophagaceae bacterium]MCW5916077.1 orotidine-5'-phosphate decarboxylase [Ferruginibacter sp.]
MKKKELEAQINAKKTFLCVGLDTDPNQIPAHLKKQKDSVIEFNRQIIDATKEFCVAYKLNTAFYEALGAKGWEIMEQTVNYIPSTHLKIADAKRGDIGNTSSQYARAFFDILQFDAITVAPYMGEDSIRPFLEYENKWTIVLGLTSNKGAENFELKRLQESGRYLYQKVLETAAQWGSVNNLMFVVGATQSEYFAEVRKIVPNHFLLVPGLGFQGGSLTDVSRYGLNKEVGMLVNASRAIIYAGEHEDFAKESAAIAAQYATEMSTMISKYVS